MAHAKSAPFAVRASRIALFLAPVIALAMAAGCSHKRTSLRPVYGAPVVVAPPCNTPGCDTPAAAVPGGVIKTEPEAEGGPILSPVPSASRSDDVNRAGGSPPVPPEATEPTLNQNPPANSGASPTPTGGIELNRPSALKSTGRMASAPNPSRRVSLKRAVAPFVPEPTDLFQPPKADRPWKYVVVHHSANASGGLDQIDRDHRKVLGFEGCGYHFVIGNGTDSPDGQIEVAPRWSNQKNGVHCRNGKNPDVNEYGIGICLVGNFDQSEPTPKQVAAAKALVAYLADRYQIPSDHLGAHDEFANGPTACPGKNFPAQAIFGTKHVAAR
jgi:N-acetylmuramoyl-L-alanine amidase